MWERRIISVLSTDPKCQPVDHLSSGEINTLYHKQKSVTNNWQFITIIHFKPLLFTTDKKHLLHKLCGDCLPLSFKPSCLDGHKTSIITCGMSITDSSLCQVRCASMSKSDVYLRFSEKHKYIHFRSEFSNGTYRVKKKKALNGKDRPCTFSYRDTPLTYSTHLWMYNLMLISDG